MASYTLSPIGGAGAQFFDNGGNPLTGGKIYTYAAGTTTPISTYTTPAGTSLNTNPIILDAAGRPAQEIWLSQQYSYKFIIKTSADVLIGTYDNIPGLPQPSATNDASSITYYSGYAATAGNFVVGNMYTIATLGTTDFTAIGAIANSIGVLFVATGTGTGTGTAYVTQYLQARLNEVVSVKNFGAVGDGVTNDTAAIQAAIDSFGTNGGVLVFPYTPNGYLYTTVTLKNSNITLDFDNSLVVGRLNLIPQSLVTSGRLTGDDYPSTWKNGTIPKPMDGDFNTMMHENNDALRIKNIRIMNMRCASAQTSVPIYAYSVDGLTINNCVLEPTGQSAIRAFHCSGLNFHDNILGGSGTYTVFGYKCREARVYSNTFKSTTATRHLSFKGAMHIAGRSIFIDFAASGTTYQYFNCLVENNQFPAGLDGVFWDTTPTYSNNAATDAGITIPLPFTSGSWFGRGTSFTLVSNNFYLKEANFASSQGRIGWFSAPHKDVLVASNQILNGQINAFGVLSFVAKNNVFNFTTTANAAIFVSGDTPSSTTMENFILDGNSITNFDALSPASSGAIGVIGFRGIISNNVGYGIGSTATGLVVLNATSDELTIENNKLFVTNGGPQAVLISGAQNTKGKKFNNDTMDTLTQTFVTDGYRNGTFTPIIVGTTSAGTGTYTVQLGRYTQIGTRCMFNLRIDWTAHTGTGNMQITQMPFRSDATANNNCVFSIWADSFTYGVGTLSCWMVSNGTTINLSLVSNGAAATPIAMDISGSLFISGSYEIAQ